MSNVADLRQRMQSLEAEFRACDEIWRAHYAFDFSEWDAPVDEIDQTIADATRFLDRISELPDKVNALREEIVRRKMEAEANRDRAQSALDAAETALSELEDIESDADSMETGEFERDDTQEAITVMEQRRREVEAGHGEKGLGRDELRPRPANQRKSRMATKSTKIRSLQDQLAALQQLIDMSNEALQMGEVTLQEAQRADVEEGPSEAEMEHFRQQIAEIARLQARLAGKAAKPAVDERKSLMDVLSVLVPVLAGIGISFGAYEYATGRDPANTIDRALRDLRSRVEDAVDRWRGTGDDDKVAQAEQALELIDEAEDAAEREGEDDKSATKSTSAHHLYA